MMRYRTIVADPPWDHSDGTGWSYGADDPRGRSGRGGRKSTAVPYGVMTLEQIAALPVDDLAAADAHLYLWTTQRYLRASFGLVEAWHFALVKLLVWCKPPSGFAMVMARGGTLRSSRSSLAGEGCSRLLVCTTRLVGVAQKQAFRQAGGVLRSRRAGFTGSVCGTVRSSRSAWLGLPRHRRRICQPTRRRRGMTGVTPQQALQRLDTHAQELGVLSAALLKVSQQLEVADVEYQAFVDNYEVGLYLKSEAEGGPKLPSEAMRLKLARREMAPDLLGARDGLARKRERIKQRIADLKSEIEAERSILSALKSEMEAGGGNLGRAA